MAAPHPLLLLRNANLVLHPKKLKTSLPAAKQVDASSATAFNLLPDCESMDAIKETANLRNLLKTAHNAANPLCSIIYREIWSLNLNSNEKSNSQENVHVTSNLIKLQSQDDLIAESNINNILNELPAS